jgi:transcriptional regulator with XRE-family HTH domain
MVLLREEIGDVLRGARQRQGRTLRDVSSTARVSLGYLSEVERGQKEASSELLLSICEALDVPMSSVLRSVSDRVAMSESLAARLPAPEVTGAPAPRGERTAPRPVDAIRKTVIPAPLPADDDLAPVA